jgi:hypothetical protein
MNHTAVCQQQETGHGANQNFSTVGIDSLSWGNCVVIGLCYSVPLTAMLRKDYSYNSTTILGKCGLFHFKTYLLPARRFRSSFFAVYHLEDRCSCNRCANRRCFRLDSKSLVNDSIDYRSSYYSDAKGTNI